MDEPMTERAAGHVPVMLNEVLTFLEPQKRHFIVDGTLGLGGHAGGILKAGGPQARLIGIDRDSRSLALARENLKDFENQCIFVKDDFRSIDKVLRDLKIERVDGIVLDLGISSFQLEDPGRGFSLQQEGPLDMRMDQEGYISAYDLVNSLSEKEISAILKNFGQERWHYRIARRVIQERLKKPIETTEELARIVLRGIPRRREWIKIHPATRTFQAFRIAVNRELEALEITLEKCAGLLNPGGRIVVIAFHSLEDRIVKEKFRTFEHKDQLRRLTKKPLRPSEEEVQQNPRSRSARLRAAERI